MAKEKGKTLATSDVDGRFVGKALAKRGFVFHHRTQALGVDWGGGGKVRHTGMAARIKKAARKVQRLGVIKRGGGATLGACRAIAAGAARYGAKVMGLPDRLLGRTRRLVRTGTSSKAGGSSLTLDLSLQKCRRVDPAFMANVEPLVKWAREVYAASSERMADLDEAWRAAVGWWAWLPIRGSKWSAQPARSLRPCAGSDGP